MSAGAVDEGGGGGDDAAVTADDFHGFDQTSAAGHDILDHDEAFAGGDGEAAPQDKGALIIFLRENVGFAELAGDFVSGQDSAEGGGNHGVEIQTAQFVGECAADLRSGLRVAQQEGTLEKFAAVQAGAQDEMSAQERAGAVEEFKGFGLCHGKSGIDEGKAGFLAGEEFPGEGAVGLGTGSVRVVLVNGAAETRGFAQADGAGDDGVVEYFLEVIADVLDDGVG